MAANNGYDSHNMMQRYVREAMRAPLLTREHEVELTTRWCRERDQSALDELVAAHARLVVSQAAQYRGYGLAMSDLLQEGSLGLMQAAARFDPEREVRFSTYAVWWIRAAIQDFVLRNWSMVRLGTTTQEKALFFNLRRVRAKVAGRDENIGDDETRRRVAEQLKVHLNQVENMEARLSGPDQSANAPLGEDGNSEWQELLIDDAPSPEDLVSRHRDTAARTRWLGLALTKLPARDQHIIRERHLKERSTTLAELGAELGISKERVRQLEHRALERLRQTVLASAAPMSGQDAPDVAASET